MAEGYEDFLAFDWSDERWVAYTKNLYPPPVGNKLLKFKKKWYKKNVDPDFDDTFQPLDGSATTETSSTGAASVGGEAPFGASSPAAVPSWTSACSDGLTEALVNGSNWRVLGRRASICGVVYFLTLLTVVGAFSGVFPPWQALVLLIAACVLEVFAKHGLAFKTAFLREIVIDDVGLVAMMQVTLLLPGLDNVIRTLSLLPGFLTATLAFSQIAKEHPKTPRAVREFFAPLGDKAARYQVFQLRAYLEIGLGLSLIYGVFLLRATLFPVILFWNFMMVRYLMSPWTQLAFKRLDGFIKPRADEIPLVRQAYRKFQELLYGFVDPNSKRFGKLCTIL